MKRNSICLAVCLSACLLCKCWMRVEGLAHGGGFLVGENGLEC